MPKTSYKILISAGEYSGDQHAAKLVSQLRTLFPDSDYKGMGGKNLRAAGVSTEIPIETYGGLNGFNFLKIFFLGSLALVRFIFLFLRWRPDALILVDYPDFNLLLAKIARLFKVKTFYFIPPKVWAWRTGRIKLFDKYISEAISIFPFEEEFFKSHGYNRLSFAGHPFATEFNADSDLQFKNREQFLRSLGLIATYPTISVLPGSRTSEIQRHLPVALSALKELKKSIVDLQAVIAVAPTVNQKRIQKYFAGFDWIKISTQDSREIMRNSDAGLLKSGTCNLEAAFIGLPFACFYKGSALAAWIVRKYVNLKEYSLVNICKSASIREFMQENTKAEDLAAELKKLIYDTSYRQQVSANLKDVVSLLSGKEDRHCYANAAAIIQKSGLTLDSKKATWRIFSFLKPQLKTFSLALLCMVLFGASDGALPLLIKQFLDGVFSSKDSTLLWMLPLLVTGLAVFRGLTGFGQEYLTAKVGHSLVKDLRGKLHSQLLRLSPGYFSSSSSGDILSRFTSDVILIRDLLTSSVASILRDSIRIIALATAAFYLDPKLSLIAFVIFPLAFFPIYKFGRRIRKLSSRGQQEIGDVSTLVQETIAGNRVIKLFNREIFEETKFAVRNSELFKTFLKSDRIKALTTPLNEVLGAIGVSAVIIYGGNSVISGTRSQGDFIAFLVSVFLLYDPFKKLSKVYHQFLQGLSGADRIFEILDVEPDIKEIRNPLPLPADLTISYENVSFKYAADKAPALKNINLIIKPGQKVALVGFSGAGKSTLVDLLPRFIDPSAGRVCIGGEDLKNLSLAELRSKISVVSQHTFLFNDTIFNNIAYGMDGATEEQIQKAAKAAYIHDFIESLPLKYETKAGEGGVALSGGERQRIAIARAILKQAPILIMDEATASLDNQAEKEVQEALDRLESGRTSIIIAHRLSTIHNADLVIVMNEGEIAEIGTHQQLLSSSGGIFSKLHALQFRESA